MVRWGFSKGDAIRRDNEMVSTLECDTRKAKDVMQYGVVTVGKDESIYRAVGLLAERKVSGLPVIHEGRLEGIISEKDVLRLLYETEFLPGLVEDYMTRDVVAFDIEDPLSEIRQCLVENSFRRVPVIYQQRLAGVITRADLIRAYLERFRVIVDEGAPTRRRDELKAKDVMKCGLLTAQPETPIYQAMELLATRHLTGLPVVDEAMHLLGVVTEKDILGCLDDPTAVDAQVEHFMTSDVCSFDQEASLFDICECLIENNFRRVPILNGQKLVGVISRADIMVYILKNKSAVFKRRKVDVAE